MAIIQISKIQVRSGNLVDLPQLDEAEFGWASDSKRLFIGKTTPNENIEILTSYSNIDFSQLTGSYGNLNISDPQPGQVLIYDQAANAWINAGGNALQPGNTAYYTNTDIHLGDASTLKIGGGAIGYILETDGTGNLSWTPKGTVAANITNASNTNPVVITTQSDNFFTPGDLITITNVSGMTELNGNSYYADVLTSNTFSLYTDSGLTTPLDGTGFSTYTGNGRAITTVGGVGGGGGAAGGSPYSVQYNYAGVSTGDASFQWNNSTSTLTVTGTSNVSGNFNTTGNITASRLVSNVSTGTSPIVVSSTTRVSNLNVAHANVADFINISTTTTGLSYLVVADALTGNVAEYANANLTFNAATGLLSTTSLSATGNANVGNLGTTGVFTTTLSATGNANVGNIGATNIVGTLTTASQTNVTAVGTLTSLSVSGNANVGNIGATTFVGDLNGNITTTNITTGANTTAGSITGNWTLTAGSRLQATYADLAEYYEADVHYEPGTVLEFGGEKEVTLAQDGTTRVAGVVSTDPAYVMNSKCPGVTVAIALQGRVPVKVRGKVQKGDIMVSAGNGYARPWNNAQIGMVIGKAIENFDGVEGTIEIAVGRL